VVAVNVYWWILVGLGGWLLADVLAVVVLYVSASWRLRSKRRRRGGMVDLAGAKPVRMVGLDERRLGA
jgi:hypothetical protein